MNDFLLVDTDILIDVARKERIAVDLLKTEEKRSILQVSSITQMELIVGCRNKSELQALDKFLRRYIIINITHDISEKAIELLTTYRLSHGLLIPDALIAATALTLDISFASKNQKDYRFISGLRLLPYP